MSFISNLLNGPSTPAAPDYVGAAEKTAAGNLDAAKYQTQANRATQITPWGTLAWSQGTNADGTGNNQWTQNISLSPDQQSALNSQMQVQNNQSSLANSLQGQVANTMANGLQAPKLGDYINGVGAVNQNYAGLDTSGLSHVNTAAPTYDPSMAANAANSAYHAQMDLMQPQMSQDTQHLDTQLRMQGLTPGTEAYNNAAQNLQRTQDQVSTQAANQSVLTGNQIASQNYQNALAGYGAQNAGQQQQYNQALATYGANNTAQEAGNTAVGQAHNQALQNYTTAYQAALQNYLQPLNSMNAVLTGQQVQSPTFSNFAQQSNPGGTNYSGAASALGQWDSGVAAQNNAANSGLMGTLGSLGAAAIMHSDRNLKTNISKIGVTEGGHNWYKWDWKDGSGSSTGVIAQEVAESVPEAVLMADDGYLAVDYSKLI